MIAVDVAAGSLVGTVMDERTNKEMFGYRMRFSVIREVVAVFRIAPRLRYTVVARNSIQLVSLLIDQVVQKSEAR